MLEKFTKKNSDYFYLVFRVVIGVLFFMHGIGKWGTITTSPFSLMGVAGIIEIVVGLLVVIGLYVKWVALIGAIQMAVAFFYVHVNKAGINPLKNNGEPALLFLVAFLVLFAYGAGKWAMDKK